MITNFKTCPECGEKQIHRVAEDFQADEDLIVPALEFYRCSSCKSVFFDDPAMRRIEAVREVTAE